jgi:hypothetical protein
VISSPRYHAVIAMPKAKRDVKRVNLRDLFNFGLSLTGEKRKTNTSAAVNHFAAINTNIET